MTHSTPQSQAQEQYSSYYRRGQQAHLQFGDFAPRRQPSPAPQASPQTHYRPVQQATPALNARTAVAYPSPAGQAVRRHPAQRQRLPRRSPRSYLLAGGSMLALAALVVGPKPVIDRNANSATARAVCQETVQAQSVLSRAELSALLAIAERAPKADVEAVVAEPYCTLPPVEVREGVTAQRVAYPLEFNPETWFIVLYENDEYAGFDFSFARE